MTTRTLILRSLRFHARSHLGALLGAAVGSAVLVGALVVGDSVRGSLREQALERLGSADAIIDSGDRFFEQDLPARLENSVVAALPKRNMSDDLAWGVPMSGAVLLDLPATAVRQDAAARANRVHLYGITNCTFFPTGNLLLPGTVWLNGTLTRHLDVRAGDSIIIRISKPAALSRDAVISSRNDSSVALRMTVGRMVQPPGRQFLENFGLRNSHVASFNAFMNLDELAKAAGVDGRANLFLPFSAYRLHEPSPAQHWWKTMREVISQRRWISPRAAPQIPYSVPVTSRETVDAIEPRLAEAWKLSDAELTVRMTQSSISGINAETNLTMVELNTRRIFLEPPVIAAALGYSKGGAGNLPDGTGVASSIIATPGSQQGSAPIPQGGSPALLASGASAPSTPGATTNGIGVLTYLVNLIRVGERAAPYSMITATGAPWVPVDMADDEILVNEWLAEDLKVRAGDRVELSYYLADSGSQLIERTNSFRVRGVVPLKGLHADRTLMPEFPGIAKAESTHDWDAGFKLTHKIRDQDEAYWKNHRGTPKAFITLAAGQKMWSNRFGNLTAIRWLVPTNTSPEVLRASIESNTRANLNPEDVGLKLEPVRERALAAANQGQDFGQLFLGFSFFLIGAALILMAMLFQFGVEQRAPEIGTLLALGFQPKQVRRLLLAEGVVLSALGAVMGVAGGIAYAKGMLWGLSTIWRSAVGTSPLRYHAEPMTLVIGAVAGTAVAALVIWFALRRQARQPARVLLAGGEVQDGDGKSDTTDREQKVDLPIHTAREKAGARWSFAAIGRIGWAGLLSVAAALGLIAFAFATNRTSHAGLFFGVGALLLMGGLAFSSVFLRRLLRHAGAVPSLGELALRNAARRRKRSLAVIALLACGSFLITSIGAFRLDSDKDATKRSSGTGGFRYIGESSLPVVVSLNTKSGREEFGLDEKDLAGVNFVQMRVRDGDDASCLNLNRAQRPRLLGVEPVELQRLNAFSFAGFAKGFERADPWGLLAESHQDGAIPAIGDAASIQWALGKKLGDTLEYTDERGREFKVRLVGAVASSILQGSLLISEDSFKERFPSETGYRMFLIDAPSKDTFVPNLTRAMQDVGFELTATTTRLASLNAVQNTYLNTFQVLGGLGLLLGSVGLGVVVLRNVLERRSELAVLLAVGFRRRAVQRLVVTEHGALLLMGLGVGVLAALVAVLPALLSPRGEFPVMSLALTLGGVLVSGAVWTWVAAALALRGKLIEALRSE
ncbi:MAG: ABC transporter permease [Pedosphaera sp.]|nr:ABC transporter permease [Pedosphaera sp.]